MLACFVNDAVLNAYLLTAALSAAPGLKRATFFALILSTAPVFGFRPSARSALAHAERSEPNQGNRLPLFERRLHAFNERVNGLFGGGFRDTSVFCNFFY
jgi:hypothetical protein